MMKTTPYSTTTFRPRPCSSHHQPLTDFHEGLATAETSFTNVPLDDHPLHDPALITETDSSEDESTQKEPNQKGDEISPSQAALQELDSKDSDDRGNSSPSG